MNRTPLHLTHLATGHTDGIRRAQRRHAHSPVSHAYTIPVVREIPPSLRNGINDPSW